ncbi:MAG: hypothetical protein RIC35_19810 [Marinoscillum sp.]
MNYLRSVLLCFLHISYFTGGSQSFDANSKMVGSIITHREELTGTIDINLALNQVLWSQDNSMRIVSASQIKMVLVEDTPKYTGNTINEEHYLFEILANGYVTILFREGIIKDEFTQKKFSGYFTVVKDKLVELERKKDFFELMGSDDKWMSLHIKNNDLNLERKEDIVKIFQYYNQTYEATHPSP